MIPLERCQRHNWLAQHPVKRRLFRNVQGLRCTVGWLVRSQWRRDGLGAPSRFAPGEWVRVLDARAIGATLDSRARLRGLWFADQQWGYCGRTLQVLRKVRRILDDDGLPRSISRTVLLDGASCGGMSGTAGCGRQCPLFFRDEWLEGTREAGNDVTAEWTGQTATVRSLDEIKRTLDARGRRDHLTFMPEMSLFCGQRLHVTRRLEWFYEDDNFLPAPRPLYVLEGLRCSGRSIGASMPCDRACGLLWHADWVKLEGPVEQSAEATVLAAAQAEARQDAGRLLPGGQH
jgi:hypothetical protein